MQGEVSTSILIIEQAPIFFTSLELLLSSILKQDKRLFQIAESLRLPPISMSTSYALSIQGTSDSSVLTSMSLKTGEWNLLTKIERVVPCILVAREAKEINPIFFSSLSFDSEMNLIILVKIQNQQLFTPYEYSSLLSYMREISVAMFSFQLSRDDFLIAVKCCCTSASLKSMLVMIKKQSTILYDIII